MKFSVNLSLGSYINFKEILNDIMREYSNALINPKFGQINKRLAKL